MQCYLSTTCVPNGRDLVTALEWMDAGGFTHVELGSAHSPGADPGPAQRWLKNGRRLLVHNYFPPPASPFMVNLGSLDEDRRARSVAQALRSIDVARSLGADWYTFHPGFLVDPAPPAGKADSVYAGEPAEYEAAFDAFQDSLALVLDHARHAGQSVALENQGSVSKNRFLMMSRPWEWRRLLNAVPDLKVLVDLGHLKLSANANDFRRDEFLAVVAENVALFHVHDNDGRDDQHLSPRNDSWFLPVLRRERFRDIPAVLESWELSLEEARASVSLLQNRG